MNRQRGNSEGSIYERSDGRWCAALKLDTGKRKVLYAKTRKEAARKLETALHARKEGTLVSSRRQSLEHYLASWLRDTVKPSVRPATYRSYSGLIRTHIAPELGNVTLEKLTPQQVQAFLNERLAAGSSPLTVAHIRAVLRTALNQAVKWQLLARNVAALSDPPRAKRYEHRAFTPDEAKRFLETVRATGDRLEALYTVALSHGLRQGEALGLRWDDVALDQGVLHVRQQLQRANGHLELVELKSDSSRRTVTLTADAVAALRNHQAFQRKEKLAERKRWQDSGLVFTTRLGGPLDGINVTRAFQRILVKAGLPKRRFHDLRHSCATLLLVQGISPKVVQAILGHSSIRLTMDTYSHVLPELQREAAEKMQAVLQR
jgi:integrase